MYASSVIHGGHFLHGWRNSKNPNETTAALATTDCHRPPCLASCCLTIHPGRKMIAEIFQTTHLCACGHPMKIGRFNRQANRQEYCEKCRKKMAIKCVFCSGEINVGDPITLYAADPYFCGRRIPSWAVVHHGEKGSVNLVGCLREGCATYSQNISGLWVAPGIISRTAGW